MLPPAICVGLLLVVRCLGVLSDFSNWTAVSEVRGWVDITTGNEGSLLAAVVNQGFIYLSFDSGLTWNQRGDARAWTAIATSANGSLLAAVATNDFIYISSDNGTSWLPTAYAKNWQSVAVSLTGEVIAACAYTDVVYISTDRGVSWAGRGGSAPIVAMSGDGSIIFAAQSPGNIYVTYNYGSVWTATGAPSKQWRSLAVSVDGIHLAAAEAINGYIWLSSDTGSSWRQSAAPLAAWVGISCSYDGSHIAASTFNGNIHISSNFGASWTSTAPTLAWGPTAISLCGGHVAAVVYAGSVYTSSIDSVPLTCNPYSFTSPPGPPASSLSSNLGPSFTTTDLIVVLVICSVFFCAFWTFLCCTCQCADRRSNTELIESFNQKPDLSNDIFLRDVD